MSPYLIFILVLTNQGCLQTHEQPCLFDGTDFTDTKNKFIATEKYSS